MNGLDASLKSRDSVPPLRGSDSFLP